MSVGVGEELMLGVADGVPSEAMRAIALSVTGVPLAVPVTVSVT
jgi:hypothetical protein